MDFFLVAKAPMLFVAKKMMRFRAGHLLQEKAILSVMHCCFSFTWKALFEINNIHKPDFHYLCYLMPSFLFQRQLHIWNLGWNFPPLWTIFLKEKKNVRKDTIKSHVFMVVRFSSFKQEWQDFRINSFCGLKHVLTAILGLFI